MRLPSVEESRVIFSASSEPPWENISSNDCSRAASISRTASPCVATVEARCSAFSRKVSVTLSPRVTMVSVMRAPVCSSLDTTSPPRRLRSSTSESPVDFSVELTSSPLVAMVSASRLEVSTMSLGELLRAVVHQLHDAPRDFCAKPCVTSSSRPSIICARLVVISANSSVMWSVLKFRLDGQPVAGAGDGVRGLLAGALQPLEQVAAALAERADHGIAGAAERERDVLALLGERLGDLLRRSR